MASPRQYGTRERRAGARGVFQGNGNTSHPFPNNVDTAQVVAYSEQHSMPYFSTSAKTGDNVTELFTTLVNEAHRKAVGSKVEGSGDGKTTLTIDATEGESSCCPV